MTNKKTSSVFSNFLYQALGKIITVALGLATTAFIYRSLGTGQYGIYVFVTSFVLLFATISDWGTEIITIREASRRPDSAKYIFGTALIIRVFLSFLAIVLANVVIRLFPSWTEFVIPVGIFSLALVGVALKTSSGAVFLAKRRALWGAATEVLNNGLYFGGLIVLLTFSPSLETALILLVLATLIAGLISFYWAKNLTSITLSLHPNFGKILLKEALPTGALLTTFYIYNRIDVVLLQHFKGNQAVGYYGLAYKIHDNLVQGAGFLMNAVLPIISSNISSEKFRLYYNRAFHLLVGGGLILATSLYVFAPQIIRLLGGPEALPALSAVRILVFATAISYLNHLTGYTLIAIGRQRVSFAIALCALLFNLTGNYILIPKFSFIAASYMTIATETIVFLLSSYVIFRYTSVVPSLKTFIQTVRVGIATRGRLFEQ